MKAIDAIEKIKVMLGMEQEVAIDSETETQPTETEIQLAEATLVDGTIVKADSFSEGAALFVVTEEGDIPAPVGVHETTEGILVTVEEEGVIAKVEEKEMEEAEKEEEEEYTSEFSSEDFLNQISELINSKFNELEERITKVDAEFSAYLEQPAGKKITNNLNQVQRSENDMAAARFQKIMEFRNQTKK